MNEPRPVTIQKVHAVLRKAGFRRSERVEIGTAREATRGYAAVKGGDGVIRVKYHFGTGVRPAPEDHDRVNDKLRDALVAAGLPARLVGAVVVVCHPLASGDGGRA